MKVLSKISRREIIKLGLGAVGGGVFGMGGNYRFEFEERTYLEKKAISQLEDFPKSEILGRVVVGAVDIKAKPDATSANVGVLYENTVVPWIREVVGTYPFRFVQRYVETPQGYIWAPYLQKVKNNPTQDVISVLPDFGLEILGMWVEVVVPFVDLVLENPPVRSPAFKAGVDQRLYYQQVVWVDAVKVNDDQSVWFRINERFGSYGDVFLAPAQAFRVIDPEETTPINPEVEEKRIEININEDVQTLSCYEGNNEVYFCRISAGQRSDITGKRLEKSATPLGPHPTYWKLYSIHMSGGASGVGWDLVGVSWATFFASPGIAIHSTFWHNNFGGEYMSHGCVNALPEDAKWIFRWTQPSVDYGQGEVTVAMPGGTKVIVSEI